ncbi:hypothetical protein, partial [Brevifollis gellanilyticus]|uniref:hypothetical protein n=1 Tax=Brevifollis gellanilyticus TaxID=748831 RepID=UPI001C3FDA23
HFHIGFVRRLEHHEREALKELWLSMNSRSNNSGCLFHYRSQAGGRHFEEYLAKDIKGRDEEGRLNFVKFPPSWLPKRVPMRLWFCMGLGRRRPAKEGAMDRVRKGKRRHRYSTAVLRSMGGLGGVGGKGECDSEHASTVHNHDPTFKQG